MKKLSPLVRILSIVAALILIPALFYPIWRIELSAPQYPEGLVLQIHADHLAGDVEVINGLNHYIGMKTLHTEDFIEFKVLPYLIGVLAFLGLLTALINRRWFFFFWVGFFVVFCIVSLIDFYRWNYNYGHNLDPMAAIQVPGMAYQPPLIGYKQLLNFGAYSIPDIGGWLLAVVGVLLVLGTIIEIKKLKAQRKNISKYGSLVLMLFLFTGCSSGPRPVKLGEDHCAHCKMTVTDIRFAAELVTDKGKIYIFDDVNCVQAYADEMKMDAANYKLYFTDFPTGELIDHTEARFLKGEALRSPMGSNTAAFRSEDSLNVYREKLNAEKINWTQ